MSVVHKYNYFHLDVCNLVQYQHVSCSEGLTLLDPGFWILVKPRGGAQSARIQFRGSKSMFDLEIRCMHWELCPTRQNQKKFKEISKMTEKSNFWNLFWKFWSSRKCPPFGQNSIFWALVFFFANILIFIVLIDCTKKTLGYRRSCVVTFENLEFFRF